MKKLFAFIFLMAISMSAAFGQAISQNGGSIQGTITDPSGAVVAGATVIISSPDTGYTHTLKTDKSGYYSLGPLVPGTYIIQVSAANFEKESVRTVVRTGTVTPGSEKLTVGSATETVEVNAGTLQINTDQIGVSGVVTKEQIDTLPINGRNILDIAQLQPGVILQSGESFDPTKAGYSAISVGGVSSRTTRILLDGQDITDENVGTTLFNVPSGAISEFQLNRSTQDVSGEVTSTGQVLLSTGSGTNKLHGNLFYNFQDHHAGFANVNGVDQPFQRNQFGGYVGGAIIKDKLFFFGGGERILQHEQDVAQASSIFDAITSKYPLVPSPFKDTYSTARLDYNAPRGIHLFVRASYSVNADVSTFGFAPYSIYTNRDNVPSIVGGADFTTGKFTHSLRYGYEKFHNLLQDATSAAGSSIYNPFPIGNPAGPITLYDGADGFYAGPNYLAPQQTFQSDKQFRYDGTWTKGAHTVKFGAEMNRILGGSYAPFFGEASLVIFGQGYGTNLEDCTTTPVNPLCGDPVNGYGALDINIGNGNGAFSEKPAFGLPGGGTPSWRFAAYVADTWKAMPSLTITAGLRWSVDTDRANQDLPTPLCSSVDPSLQFPGCTGNSALFSQYRSDLGYKTHQPYANFGPQAGFVFSPGNHKLSIRGGAGLYYESDIFNNTGNSRTESIQSPGQFQNTADPCQNFYPGTSLDNGTNFSSINITNLCGGGSIASIASNLGTIRSTYQKLTSGVTTANPAYIGSATGDNLKALNIYAGPYLSPYSIQLNGGVQQELAKGLIISADFVHNATLKVPLSIDVNNQGAARNINVAAAKASIANAIANVPGCATINCVIANEPVSGWAYGGPLPLPLYLEYFGLTSANDGYLYGGAPGNQYGGALGTNLPAFGGTNNNVGVGDFILPIGKSGYDALQVVLQQQKSHPVPYIDSSNLQISYSLSRIVSNAGGTSDQFFAGTHAFSNDQPGAFMGRNPLDHTNQLSFGGSFGVKYGLQVGFIGHFYSAPPTTLYLDPNEFGGAAEIFRTDVDGDGTQGDLLPGTLPGAYMHQVKAGSLNSVIKNYNSTHAGQVTPAGQALINNGILTQAQLVAIGDVQQPIALAPTTPIMNSAFRSFDFNVSYPIKLNRIREGLAITPGVVMYNVTNMANFGNPVGTLLNVDDGGGAVGTVNSALNGPNNQRNLDSYRVERGSGTFDQGGPRTTEFQLKIAF